MVNFKSSLSLFILFLISYVSTQDSIVEIEGKIIDKILFGYNRNLRPQSTVNVGLMFSILKISSIDEVNGVMHSSVNIYAGWLDTRLAWDSRSYGISGPICIIVSKIWLPDLSIINTADKSIYIIDNASMAYVWSDGRVLLNIGLEGKLRSCINQMPCKMKLFNFFL